MTFREAFLLPALVLVLAVNGICVNAAPQALQNHDAAAPLCDPAVIDGSFTFASQPAGEQTVSLHFLNKGNVVCRLHGMANPSFGVDGHSMTVGSCWLCDDTNRPLPSMEQQPGNQILLAPGERARLDLHWASNGEPCQWADDGDFFFTWAKQTGYLFIPSNWPMHICSVVKSSGYQSEADSSSGGEVNDSPLRVSVTPEVIYGDEQATLHVELAAPTGAAASGAGCVSLYMVRSGAAIGTRFEPLFVTGSSMRPSYTPEQVREDKERAWASWKTDRLRRCDIAGGQLTADARISAADLANVTHLEWRTAPRSDEDPVFLMVDTHFNVLDVDTLSPNWGDPVQGIRAGLSVDRVRFKLGERIPLHFRWENVNATMPLGEGECKEPEPSLEIQDARHNVIRTIPTVLMCMVGHGWGPFRIEKGKPQQSFLEYATVNPAASAFTKATDPPGPGVYYLVSVWSPSVLEADPVVDKGRIGVSGHLGKAYATARSLPVRVEVVADRKP